jgi:hypothetical protein
LFKSSPAKPKILTTNLISQKFISQKILVHRRLISSAAKHNRKIMSNALTKAGFVNYLGEYWHWSYGDRYWAYFTKKDKAIYGSIKDTD